MIIVVASVTTLVLLATCLLSVQAAPTIVLVGLLGLIGLSANPVLASLAVRFAGVAPPLGVAMSVSAYNLGTAAGSGIAGLTLSSTLGATGPTVVGTVIAGLTLVATVAITLVQRRGRPDRSSRAEGCQVPRSRPRPTAAVRPGS